MKPMLLTALACLACLPATPTAARDKLPEGARRLEPTQLALTISTDGKPGDIRCISENARRLCGLLTRAVSGWSFEAGRRSDTPAAMDVFLNVTLVAVPQSSGFVVQALDGELMLRGPNEQEIVPMPPPSYPREAMMRGDTGMVELELLIEPGRPTYRVGRMWFKGTQVGNRGNDLVAASVKAAERQPVRSPPPELLSECLQIVYTLVPGPEPKPREKACKDTHVPGFTPPRLLTDVTQARF